MSLLGERHMLYNALNKAESLLNNKRLAFLEGHATITGCTNILRFVELKTELVNYCKAMKEFENAPFEPATLDNANEAYINLGTSYQVFTSQCFDYFDARDVVDFSKLRDVIDDMFRCAASLKDPYKLRPLQVLASSIVDLVVALIKIDKTVDENFTIPLSEIIDPSFIKDANLPTTVTFTELDSQKYFTDEEREEVRKAEEQARLEAIRAKEEQELAVKNKDAIDTVRKLCFNNSEEEMREKLLSFDTKMMFDAVDTLMNAVLTESQFRTFCETKFSTIGDMEFQLKKEVGTWKMNCATKLMSAISGNDITVKSIDTGIDYSDESGSIRGPVLAKGEWIVFISHK